jgi:hypothetical protein
MKASDGRFYNVNKGKQKEKKAELLAEMRGKLMSLIKFCINEDFDKAKRLKNWSGIIEEAIPDYQKHAGYSVNKGERIGVCVTNDDDELENKNTIFFILMHELAHIMCKTYDHSDEFWQAFEFIIKVAIDHGLYTYENFDKNPIKFCGHNITYTPLKTI